MNANSPPPALVIKNWVKTAMEQLAAVGIASARLDAELILSHTLRKDRTYLHAHSDDILEPRVQKIVDARLALRLDRIPIAYIVGYKEFYGRRFSVTTDTLIPRPESEDVINLLKRILLSTTHHLPSTTLRLIDIGTGSGCLGITAKLEFPELEVTLADISPPALAVASDNAQRLQADVTIIKSDLLHNYLTQTDIILANLPYVDSAWEVSPDTVHEPSLALFASDGGIALIKKLINQTSAIISQSGFLVLEADPFQHESIVTHAKRKDFTLHSRKGYVVVFKKIKDQS